MERSAATQILIQNIGSEYTLVYGGPRSCQEHNSFPHFSCFDSSQDCILKRAYFNMIFQNPYVASLNDLLPFHIAMSIYITKLYIRKLTLY